jgi:hypothetical protein
VRQLDHLIGIARGQGSFELIESFDLRERDAP